MKKLLLLSLSILVILQIQAQSVSDMLENAISSVVTVAVYKTGIAQKTLGFRGGDNASDIAYEKALKLSGAIGSGSGFVILRNGKKYVVTNAHVVQDASDEAGSIYIFSINGKKYEVRIIGGDSFYDIALLEFKDTPGSEITVIDFKKTEPRIGETVYAIGNPLGEYPYSISNGIISAKNRVRDGFTGKFGFLQTTATIIWGNSGGPLLDAFGKVAGVNTKIAFATSPTGEQVIQSQINFAIEAKYVEKIVNDILATNGRVRRAYIGIEVSQKSEYRYISKDKFDYVQIDTQPVLSGIIPGSPAYSLLSPYVGYVITHINKESVRNLEEVLGEFEKMAPNTTFEITLVKGPEVKKVTISSAELFGEQLENIATYVLDQVSKIQLIQKTPQVVVQLAKENFYSYQNNKFSGGPINKSPQSQGGNTSYGEKYNVLAAGVVADDWQSMWKSDDLKNLGAAFRLCGIAGVIDFYLLKPYDNMDNIEVMRHYLSGNENIFKSTLWY